MNCPTCGLPRTDLLGTRPDAEVVSAWYCVRCGTIWSDGFPPVVPSLVINCRKFEEKLHKHGAGQGRNGQWLVNLWKRLDIERSIHKRPLDD